MKNPIATLVALGFKEVLLLRSDALSCFPGTLRNVTMAAIYLLWECWFQTIRKKTKMKRNTGRKKRDKEALKWREWQGGGGSLQCQLCFKHLQQAELNWADVLWHLHMTWIRWEMLAGEVFIWGYFLNLDMWQGDKKAVKGRKDNGLLCLVLASGRVLLLSSIQQSNCYFTLQSDLISWV